MKLVKKWLLPVLTCLIVAGAAVLPPCVSQARDAGQFWPEHIEELGADSAPAWKGPGFLERLELYAGQSADEHPILSFSAPLYYGDPEREEVIERAKAALTETGILPSWYFTDEPFEDFTGPIVTHVLLWDPADGASWQEPSTFWRVTFQYHSKSGEHYKHLTVEFDDESGLPISLAMSDTEMAKWLPYQVDALQAFMERWFGALGLTAQLQGTDRPEPDGLVLDYAVADTDMGYWVEHNATILGVAPTITFGGESTFGGSDAYDG